MFIGMHLRRGRPGERGSSVVEMAIMSPILVAMVLWMIYFWEMQQARLKSAEAARYIAFNQTVGASTSDVPARFEDLDSSTPVGKMGKARFNKLTITKATQALVNSPMADPRGASQPSGLSGLASSLFGAISGVMGKASSAVFEFHKLDLSDGRVQTSTEFAMQNMLIPKRIGNYLAGSGGPLPLDLTFKDSMTLDYKTFAAVNPGVWGALPYPYDQVSDITTDAVRKMVFLTLLSRLPGFISTALHYLGTILSIAGIQDFPFDIEGDYIPDTTRIYNPARGAPSWNPNFRYGVSDNDDGKNQRGFVRTAPGDKYYAWYWKGNPPADRWCSKAQGRACEPTAIQNLRDRDNPDYRAYNCRDWYYLGTTRSQFSEVEYSANERKVFRFNGSGCQ
jgi:hypothetical protein